MGNVQHRWILVATLLLGFTPVTASADQSALRTRVLSNLQASTRARVSSGFQTHLQIARGELSLRRSAQTPAEVITGPTAVPHRAVVISELSQPSVLFDKADPRLKRQVLAKAAKLRLNSTQGPWEKVARLQKIILQKVKAAGNELSFEKNPNAYTRFNHQSQGKLVRLGDYLAVKQGACRELAFFTQVALEAAGFEARLVSGTIRDAAGKALGGHAWNEIKLDGKWQIVDTTNPGFNRTDPQRARSRGTGGWYWHAHHDRFFIGRISDWKAFKSRQER